MRKKKKQAESEGPQLEPRRITPVDIQQKEFRLAMRGYNERDVDQFLDEVTEEVARLYADNKRLREEIEFNRTTRLPTTDSAESEAIIRRAREEAARIIAEAGARASTMAASADTGQAGGPPGAGPASAPTEAMSVFLARERAFLQNMANLIQAHAEGVKQDVRRVRDHIVRQAPAGSEPPAHAGVPDESVAPSATDEPTQAWDVGASEAEPKQKEASPEDVVDLTHRPEGEPEGGREWVPGHAPGGSQPFPRTNEPNRAVMQTGPATGPGRGARAAGDARPRVEDEDAREDRSLRELFWGEE